MQLIPLTKGKFTLVDSEDYEELAKHKWRLLNNTYAVRWQKKHEVAPGEKRKLILMHREIMQCNGKEEVDHISHDGLNNQKYNLRKCSHAENQCNQISNRGKSKYKGVSYVPSVKKWRARITHKGTEYHLGNYLSQDYAAEVYNKYAVLLYKEFAKLNIIK
jgi:hypothetical protein